MTARPERRPIPGQEGHRPKEQILPIDKIVERAKSFFPNIGSEPAGVRTTLVNGVRIETRTAPIGIFRTATVNGAFVASYVTIKDHETGQAIGSSYSLQGGGSFLENLYGKIHLTVTHMDGKEPELKIVTNMGSDEEMSGGLGNFHEGQLTLIREYMDLDDESNS